MVVALITHLLEERRKKRGIKVENHRKEIEIKVDIVSKIAEVLGTSITNARIAADRQAKEVNTDDNFQYMKSWIIDGKIIRSKLDSYFSETDIRERWDAYTDILSKCNTASIVYFLGNRSEVPNEQFKKSIRRYKKLFFI